MKTKEIIKFAVVFYVVTGIIKGIDRGIVDAMKDHKVFPFNEKV